MPKHDPPQITGSAACVLQAKNCGGRIMQPHELTSAVWSHLLSQGRPCLDDTDPGVPKAFRPPVFRNKEGLRSAVGCLIADEHWRDDLNDRDVNHPETVEALHLSGVPVFERDVMWYLTQVETVHDNCHPARWRSMLRTIGLQLTQACMRPIRPGLYRSLDELHAAELAAEDGG